MNARQRRSLLWLFTAACAAVVCASPFVGTESLDWDAVRAGLGGAPETPSLFILLELRIPRTLAALLAGAGLALAGCAFQVLLRNPLATPYTLGVASAGALGAWCAILLADAGFLGMTLLGFSSKQALAFLFALADVALVYVLATRRGRPSPTILLLAGVTLGMLANTGIMLSRYLATPDRLVSMDRWLMGGVDITGYASVWVLLAALLPCGAVLMAQAAKFDQYAFGVELAAGRGIDVPRLQFSAFFTASLLTAFIVAEVGPIGFVGLVVPHTVRAFTGPRHRILLPVSMLGGGAFLCACDLAARRLDEMPIGIVTTMIGAPFFLFLLMRGRFTDWDA